MNSEMIFWIVACVAAWIGFGILAKKASVNYVDMEGWK